MRESGWVWMAHQGTKTDYPRPVRVWRTCTHLGAVYRRGPQAREWHLGEDELRSIRDLPEMVKAWCVTAGAWSAETSPAKVEVTPLSRVS